MFKKKKYSAENATNAWKFLLPAFIIIIIFNIYPLLRAFTMSFTKGTQVNSTFVGMENYATVIKDPRFHLALKNTMLYSFIVVPVSLVISTGIALVIHNKVKFKGFFETLFFIPYVTSTIAIGVVFRYLFNQEYGIINFVLNKFGIESINFLDSINMSMPTLIIFGIWSGLAFNIIILLTGLKNIDEEYYKVADMFGANRREQFFKITLPQLIPTFTFLLTVNFINAFKVYSQIYSLFNGQAGMAKSAISVVYYIFDKFHTANKYGVAMAATMILFVLILIFTVIQNKILAKVDKR